MSYLSGSCDTIQWPNLSFHCVFENIIESFSSKYGMRRRIMDDLLLVVISSPLLFSLLHEKVHIYLLCFWHFNFNPNFFNFIYLCYYLFYKSFVCFQFSHSITIYRVLFFSFRSLLSWFIFFFLDFFVKSLLVFNFIFQSKFSLFNFSFNWNFFVAL